MKHLALLILFSLVTVSAAYHWLPPMSVRVGADAEGYLTGFYRPQPIAGRVARWSAETAIVRFDAESDGTPIKVSVSAYAQRYQDRVFTATVTLNGIPIGAIDKAGWRNWSFVTADPAALNSEAMAIGLHATPFTMDALFRDSDDNRTLGIAVDSIRIEPQRPSLLFGGAMTRTAAVPALPLGIAILLATSAYLLARSWMVTASWAFAAAMSGLAAFSIGLAFFRLEATLRVLLFGVCTGAILSIWGLRKTILSANWTCTPGRSRQLTLALNSKSREMRDWLVFGIGIMLALGLRYSQFGFVSGDYDAFVRKWYALVQQAGFSAYGVNFSNYTPGYLYILQIVSVIFPDLPSLLAVKLISTFFDIVCAVFVSKLVRLKYENATISLVAFLVVLFAPTVVMNSAVWGQADSIYTAGMLAFLYFVLSRRPVWAFAAFGVAFAFKAQALFLAPLLVILFFKRRVSWQHFLVIPVVYLLFALPAWLAGQSLTSLVTVYISQVDTYPALTANAPNLYAWFHNTASSAASIAGVALAAVVAAAFVALVLRSKVELSVPVLVEIALASVLLLPFFLPRMHERYFYPADVLSIVFAFYYPRYGLVSAGIILVSFFSYFFFLFGNGIIPLPVLALALLVLISIVMAHLFRSLYRPETKAA